ncbi:hypothetical protein COCOBI_11-1670 [Coccomyxa sp. Obi]|nr:hypothetical protein COCOBI_11-1670 [Coccomyxa sp. Obi]
MLPAAQFSMRRPAKHQSKAMFCEACGGWVTSPPDHNFFSYLDYGRPPSRHYELWQQHLCSDQHARRVAARLAVEAELRCKSRQLTVTIPGNRLYPERRATVQQMVGLHRRRYQD